MHCLQKTIVPIKFRKGKGQLTVSFSPFITGENMKIENPVLRGFYPDPSVCFAKGKYYLVNSTFELFPAVPIFESTDLVNWRQIGHCLTQPAQAKLNQVAPSRGIWAPTIRFYNDTFYMCTVNMDGGGNFFVTAKDPCGPWSDPVYVPMKSIDPSMFFENGRAYFMTPQTKKKGDIRGIYMAEINLKTGALLTNEILLWQGSGGKCLEAPHLYHINDYYYLLCAEGGTEYGHGVTMARSEQLFGPYESCPHNPIITNRNDHDNPLQCAGHADLIKAPDGSYAVLLLASRWSSKWHSQTGRETCLMPVSWHDGWLFAQKENILQKETEIPWLNTSQNINSTFEADFESQELVYLRNPVEKNYIRSKQLTLFGGGELHKDLQPTFLGYRQHEHSCVCTAELNLISTTGEAGLSVYLSPNYHFDIFIAYRNNVCCTILRQVVGEYINTETFAANLSSPKAQLIITAKPLYYQFAVKPLNGDIIALGKAESRLISNETAKLFTGVLFGMYCAGQNAKAVFTKFNCTALNEGEKND